MAKKFTLLFFYILVTIAANAQESPQYAQFMLNDYGVNPAVAGSKKGIYFMIGKRVQFANFPNAPQTNFANITKDFGKKGAHRYWHGAGIYLEDDNAGIYSIGSAYVSYAIHLKMSTQYSVGFALAAGVRSVTISNIAYEPGDPALSARNPNVILPNVFPGVYLYSKKTTVSLSIRNLYKNQLEQGSKKVGSTSKFTPTLLFTINKKYWSSGYDFLFVPAINLQSTFTSLPAVQLNCMAYYRQRVGLGLSYRMHYAAAAMIHFRVFSNMTIGFAYEYAISKLYYAGANSNEIMMGFSPNMSIDESGIPKRAADCPKFEF